MEKDFGSWFHHQLSDQQSPNWNALSAPFDLGRQNSIPACMSPHATNGTLPGFAFSGGFHSKVSQPIEPHGWFYCLPRFRQAFTPVPNTIFKEEAPAAFHGNHEEVVAPKPNTLGCAQKRFLVFDQSGDQTTLIFSSAIGNAVPCSTLWEPKLSSAIDLNKIELGTERDTIKHLEPILTDEDNENQRDDMGSEMHEDTEELNALLYSDEDDDYSEDDEVASTGHSPSTMTAYDKEEQLEENAEEVASSGGPTKRVKLFDGVYDVASLMDTGRSVKSKRCFDYEDDAESSCGNGKNEGLGEFGSFSGKKRSRKDKIRETVSILQSIIPGAKGKDANAVVILDEAINYLKSLKHKVEAIGLEAV